MENLNHLMDNLYASALAIARNARAEAERIRQTPVPSISGPDPDVVAAQKAKARQAIEGQASALDLRATLYERRAAHLAQGVYAIEPRPDHEWAQLSTTVKHLAMDSGRTVVDVEAPILGNRSASNSVVAGSRPLL